MNRLLYLFFVIVCWSCAHNSTTEKYHSKRNNIIDVHGEVKEIRIEDVLIGPSTQVSIIGDYLIVGDYQSQDKLIHLFDKTKLEYVTSIAYRGGGPGEIANMGYIGIDITNKVFYVSDHGKQKIFSYDLDSVLVNPLYLPKVKMRMNNSEFPDKYQYIKDSLCIGLRIEPTGNSGYNQSLVRWNMDTGESEIMKYTHPAIEKKRVNFAVSVDDSICVECYSFHDLITLCDISGNLICNIYGPKWDSKKSNEVRHYGSVEICRDRIFALYLGEANFIENSNEIRSNLPTEFLVFDINGDYIQTLKTGYRITGFCYDKDNNRIIMSMDDEMQFAYLDLDELIVQ